MRVFSRLGAYFFLICVASCGDVTGGPSDSAKPPGSRPTSDTSLNIVSTLVVNPDSAELARDGETAQFSARPLNMQGMVVSAAVVAWRIGDTLIARVDNSGMVTARSIGQTTVTATAGSVSGSRPIRVVLQRNRSCSAPGMAPEPTTPRAAPSWSLGTVSAALPPYILNDVGVLDLDADNDQDVIVASWRLPNEQGYTGTFRAWRNIGADLRDATTEVFGSTLPIADHPLILLTGDFDRNGRQDLFVPQQGLDAPPFPGAPSLLLLQSPAGSLLNASTTNLSSNAAAVTHWGAIADIDCDGDLDLYKANIGEAGGGPQLLRNNGAGNFAAVSALPSAISSLAQRYTSSAFCDVDRDGDQDLVLGGWRRRDDLLLNDGFGSFRFAASTTMPNPFFAGTDKATTHLYCIDLDRDGWPDVISSTTDNYTVGRITVYQNRRDGTFEDRTNGLPQRLQEWYSKTFVADFNADGYPDILASQPIEGAGSAGSEVVWINRGDLTFTETLLPADVRYARLFPFDLDGDGRLDVLAIDLGKGRVQVLRNTGS